MGASLITRPAFFYVTVGSMICTERCGVYRSILLCGIFYFLGSHVLMFVALSSSFVSFSQFHVHSPILHHSPRLSYSFPFR